MLECLRSTIFGCKNIWVRKSEFVTKTQFLFNSFVIFLANSEILKIKNLNLPKGE